MLAEQTEGKGYFDNFGCLNIDREFSFITYLD